MSKAILVVDTPKDCVCCPFKGYVEWFGSICIPYDSIHREELRRHLEITNGRPEWCPLKTYKDIIPIEWIKARLKKAVDFTHSKAEGQFIDNGCVVSVVSANFTANVLLNLLEDWRKENE